MYHVLNRGNGRLRVFHKPGDYQAFLDLLILGKERANVEVFGFCLMPNHWHLVLRPQRPGDLAGYLSWVTNTHVKRYRAHSPHERPPVSGPLQELPGAGGFVLSLAVAVCGSQSAAGKTSSSSPAQDWEWSSLGCNAGAAKELLSPWPLRRPPDWTKIVNRPPPDAERERIKASLERGRPLGDDRWTAGTARRMGLQFTLNPRGRPRMQADQHK